jgi:hypothetical protein
LQTTGNFDDGNPQLGGFVAVDFQNQFGFVHFQIGIGKAQHRAFSRFGHKLGQYGRNRSQIGPCNTY